MKPLERGYLVLSRILEGKTLRGFLLANETGHLKMISLNGISQAGKNVYYYNAEYDEEYKTLVGTQNTNIATDYPAIKEDYTLISKDGIIVMANVLDSITKKPVGVAAFNGSGMRMLLSYKKLNSLSLKFKFCNFDMKVVGNYGMIAVRKDGELFPVIEMEIPKKPTQTLKNGKSALAAEQEDENVLPVLKVYSLDYVKDSEFTQSSQDRLVRTMLNMQRLTPYYYTVLMAIKRKPAPLGTMGVTENVLLYDMAFVSGLSVAELTFILIHEIMHIAMQHSIRFGTKTNPSLWNIATDLYINSIICNDFGCEFGHGVVTNNVDGRQVEIKTPDFGVYMETIGIKIDLAVDTPESIYKELLQENPNYQGGGNVQSNQGQSQSSGQGQSQGSNQGSGQGQSGQSSGQEASNQSGQGSGSGSGSNGSDQGNNQSSGSQSEGQNQNQDKGSNGGQSGNGDEEDRGEMNDLTNKGSGEYSPTEEVNVIFRGKKLTGTIMKDIMTNKSVTNQDAQKESISASRDALQKIKTKIQLEEQESGVKLSKNAGAGGNLTQRYIEVGLSAGVDWRILLKNMCKDKPKKTFTLAQPNEAYMNMGMTVADRRPIGKPTHIAHVKFAVDVSGSVSQEELQVILSEINNIYTYYKVDGELIYWSTMIGDAGYFSSLKDMLKIKPVSDGGTDVKCVFDYLSGQTKVHGKAESDKMRDIKAVFIITDGYFSHNYKEYEKAFGKKVVWLITGTKGNPITFDPHFGRVIGIEMDNN